MTRPERVTGSVAYHGEGPAWSERWGGLRFSGDVSYAVPHSRGWETILTWRRRLAAQLASPATAGAGNSASARRSASSATSSRNAFSVSG